MAQNSLDPQPPAGETALRKLIARLLAPPDPYGEQTTDPPQVFVEELPGDLPNELVIPDSATIVGSVVQDRSRGLRSTEIVLEAPVSAEQFRSSYRQLLLDTGWTEDEDLPAEGGFVAGSLPVVLRPVSRFPRLIRRLGFGGAQRLSRFHRGGSRTVLMVAAQDRQEGLTDVHLTFMTGRRGPRRVSEDPAWTILPRLHPPPRVRGRSEGRLGVLAPPPGARKLGGNFTGSGDFPENDGAYSYVALEVDCDLQALIAHYAAQLEKAGWTWTNEGADGPQAWSTWVFTDEESRSWTGTFSALRLPATPARYLLQIHAGHVPRR